MMLFFELFIRKILESQVLRNGRTTVTVRRSEANRVPPGRGVDASLRTGRLRAAYNFSFVLQARRVSTGFAVENQIRKSCSRYFDGCSKGLLVFVV